MGRLDGKIALDHRRRFSARTWQRYGHPFCRGRCRASMSRTAIWRVPRKSQIGIRATGGTAYALAHDVTSESDWDRVMAEIDSCPRRAGCARQQCRDRRAAHDRGFHDCGLEAPEHRQPRQRILRIEARRVSDAQGRTRRLDHQISSVAGIGVSRRAAPMRRLKAVCGCSPR